MVRVGARSALGETSRATTLADPRSPWRRTPGSSLCCRGWYLSFLCGVAVVTRFHCIGAKMASEDINLPLQAQQRRGSVEFNKRPPPFSSSPPTPPLCGSLALLLFPVYYLETLVTLAIIPFYFKGGVNNKQKSRGWNEIGWGPRS